jgi:cell wall integrity and stress response component
MQQSLLAILATAATVASAVTLGNPQPPVLGTVTIHGCSYSLGDLKLNSVETFNSAGVCAAACIKANKAVAATLNRECFCGDSYPYRSAMVESAMCDVPCPGFPREACGATVGGWSVYNVGLKVNVPNYNGTNTASNATTTTASTYSTGTSRPTGTLPSTTPSSSVVPNAAAVEAPAAGRWMAVVGVAALFFA